MVCYEGCWLFASHNCFHQRGWHKRKLHNIADIAFADTFAHPDLKRAIWDQAQVHQATNVIIEDKASGTQLIQELMQGGLGCITPYVPQGGDKIMRLHSQSAAFENGLVLLPSEAPWLADYVHELTTLPGSRNDDQVDSTTQALWYMRQPNPWAAIMDYYKDS
ncbi:MAG: phage terminase large subunit [Pseudomonadota bacterium]